MSEILLIRHGQASFGSSNYDRLSAIGQQQAKLLGPDLHARGLLPQRVIAGTLERQQNTAKLALAEANLPHQVETNGDWNEFDFQQALQAFHPDYHDTQALQRIAATEANPQAFMAQQSLAAFRRWQSGDYDSDYQETHSQFCGRVVAGLMQAAEHAAAGERLWVASSGGAIAAVVQHLLKLDNDAALAFNWQLVNAGVTKLRVIGDQLKLVSFNDHALLERHQLVTHR